jgi:predicted ABC-class ATPase
MVRVPPPPDAPGLRGLLRSIDGASYAAYRRILGRHEVGEFVVVVDRVPPDPYAGPARVRLVCDRTKAHLPSELVSTRARRIGVEDYLARSAVEALASQLRRGGNAPPGSGRISMDPPGPAMLERGASRITSTGIELRLFVDLPALERKVLGQQAESLFFSDLARLATATLLFSSRRVEDATRFADAAEDHEALQAELAARGLVAFVADGSLLARAGGDDAGPRKDGREVPFEAPESLAATVRLPHAGPTRGMGIPAGVTLIVGGGFHGKSTLLDAVAAGVHPHRPGDGRDRVAALASALVVRSEDGRAVRRVDVSGFLSDLPSGERSVDFTTERASGSTSIAAAIAEAVEVGARVLLVDEDKAATNFMIRDGRMQRLVPRSQEPIVPFLDRVVELYRRMGVSTLLVTGGSGDYLEVADTVILMHAYRAEDATKRAREVAAATRSMRLAEPVSAMQLPAARRPTARTDGERPLRVGLRGPRSVRIGDETLDLSALEPIEETGQIRALAYLLREAADRMADTKTMRDLLGEINVWLDEAGLDALDPPAVYDLSRPRSFDLAAAINRWRSLAVAREDG